MKNMMMKKGVMAVLGAICSVSVAQAQFGDFGGGAVIGGGYLDKPGTAYGFGQLRGKFYEDDSVAHTVFLEVLGHQDDAEIVYRGPGGGFFFEDGDISFVNVTLNYELEAKLAGPFSLYAGGGIGAEFVSLDDRFDYELDTDTNFVAQVFGGVRTNFPGGLVGQAGVRYIFRDDFSLLGDQFYTEDSVAFELSFGFQF